MYIPWSVLSKTLKMDIVSPKHYIAKQVHFTLSGKFSVNM